MKNAGITVVIRTENVELWTRGVEVIIIIKKMLESLKLYKNKNREM